MGHNDDLPSPKLKATAEASATAPLAAAARQLTTRRFRYRSEAARDRDVLRYMQTWEDTYKPLYLHRNTLGKDGETVARAACPDSSVSALAQLAAIRMQVRRCLITLTCATTEWVLCDVGQRTSLQPVANPRDGAADRPWIGTSSFPRSQSLSNVALVEWRKARRARIVPQEDDLYYVGGLSEHSLILEDLRHDLRYQALEQVRQGPWIRFCCAIPLRDSNGSVLGSLTLVDDKPRYGVSADEMTLLEDLGDTVVEHLSATLGRARRQRGERLISSLGLFHAGEDSLRDWWLAQDDTRIMNTGRNVDKGTAADRQARVDAAFGLHPYYHGGDDDHETLSTSIQTPPDYFGTYPVSLRSQGVPSHLPVKGAKNHVEPTQWRSGGKAKSDDTTSSLKSKREPSNDFDLARSTMSTYKRASNLLREALGADGVVFVDAANVTLPLDSDADDLKISPSDSNGGTESSVSDHDNSDPVAENAQTCKIQGTSMRDSLASPGDRRTLDRVHIPEHYLQRLIKRCPQGFVVHFDLHGRAHRASEDATSSQSSSEEVSAAPPKRKKDFQRLSKIFSGARVLSAFPMRDDGSARWRSCVFVWTTAIGRCFGQGEDLVFLKTFAISMSAEFSRLESIAADLSKATFISSISHELRSPLHGILAGAEFLHDTPLTDFQLEMTHAISMAGRTLLDTVNHVLDYTKIKSTTKKRGVATKPFLLKAAHQGKVDAVDEEAYTDLARLTEEVVETTVTAHRLHNGGLRSPLNDRSAIPGSPIQRSPSASSNVSISLTIAHRENWVVTTQPGGWTRILTNLVGNAIKYTKDGHIAVRLSVGEPLGSGPQASNRHPVQLTIEDTGIGMSDTFLAHGLFIPFKQENPYADGTGLGLSIVKQIVRGMGAELEMFSKLGEGTTAQVRFIAEFVAEEITSDVAFSQDSLPNYAKHLNVDRLQLLPGPYPESADPDVPLRDSVVGNAREWLGCEIIRDTKIVQGDGTSLCGITERDLVDWQTDKPKLFAKLMEKVASEYSHIFVIGRSIASVTLSCALPIRPVFVHQPVGPRKLLRAIASDRSSTVSGEQSEDPPIHRHVERQISNETARTVTPNTRPNHIGRRSISSQSSSLARSQDSRSGSPASRDQTETLPTSSSIGTVSRGLSFDASVASSSASGTMAGRRDPRDARTMNDTVLLVEDNEINMKFLIALLIKLEVPYECAANGLEAVRTYARGPESFFLILMDMSMPVMDGFAATSKIRQVEQTRRLDRTYIMALTGVTDAAERERAYDSGVDDFQSKPVRMKHLKMFIDARRQRT
ncbi:hypothetical protein DOTSEDRAFT_71196 [Dothistroma septosporum NZE10]|uniref:histidine kinase n=1 Tax=Dothistroma septosporum (strain NZE10 / CBS 128990) TaxID=675120 RepID=N1PSP3_DOTSN|nr:hypothetical protein DOTSEDRAFT_71196 [Dothistroma septosporum NZE10]